MSYKKDKASGKSTLKKKGSAIVLESIAPPAGVRTVFIEHRQVVRGSELAQSRLRKAASEHIAAQEAFDDAEELFNDWEILNA